jgi:LAGLIDADG DNA endonuclease family protein
MNRDGRYKYRIDEGLFEKIDSPWKAYFLGWMFADGYITKDLRAIRLTLAIEDKNIIDFFASKLYKGKASRHRREPYSFVAPTNGKTYVGQPQCGLSVHRGKIARDLFDKGLIPRKSLTLVFPSNQSVPDHLMGHFIRGYFEGDGSIHKPRGGRCGCVSILGSRRFLLGLRRVLAERHIQSSVPRKTNRTIWIMAIANHENVCRFANLIYKDADHVLKRKRKRFDALFASRDNAHVRNKTAPFVGVNLASNCDRYMVRASINGQRHFVGHYSSPKQARNARSEFLESKGLHVRRVA